MCVFVGESLWRGPQGITLGRLCVRTSNSTEAKIGGGGRSYFAARSVCVCSGIRCNLAWLALCMYECLQQAIYRCTCIERIVEMIPRLRMCTEFWSKSGSAVVV